MDEQEFLIDAFEQDEPALRRLAVPGGRSDRARVLHSYMNVADFAPGGGFTRVQDAFCPGSVKRVASYMQIRCRVRRSIPG